MIPIKDENPTYSFPFVTVAIIVIDTLLYLYQSSLGFASRAFVLRLGAIPYEITHLVDIQPLSPVHPPLTLFTSLFIHGGFAHLAGNMLFLWIFGNNVEDHLGHTKYLIFYILSGLMASLLQIATNIDSTVPMIGASGAIAGIMGAYIVLYPRAQILTLVFFFFFIDIIRVPAVIFIGIWFLFQILSASTGGGVAWYAHIGGFIGGLILIRVMGGKRRRRRFRY